MRRSLLLVTFLLMMSTSLVLSDLSSDDSSDDSHVALTSDQLSKLLLYYKKKRSKPLFASIQAKVNSVADYSHGFQQSVETSLRELYETWEEYKRPEVTIQGQDNSPVLKTMQMFQAKMPGMLGRQTGKAVDEHGEKDDDDEWTAAEGAPTSWTLADGTILIGVCLVVILLSASLTMYLVRLSTKKTILVEGGSHRRRRSKGRKRLAD